MRSGRGDALRMIVWGLLVVLAGILLHTAFQVRPSATHAAFPSAAALNRRVRRDLVGMAQAAGETHTIWVGQQVSRSGGVTTHYSLYAEVVQRHGRVAFWGSGTAFWPSYENGPDIELIVHPVVGVVHLKEIARPSDVPGPRRPPLDARWYALSTSPGPIVIAHDAAGVWVYQQHHGQLALTMGPAISGT